MKSMLLMGRAVTLAVAATLGATYVCNGISPPAEAAPVLADYSLASQNYAGSQIALHEGMAPRAEQEGPGQQPPNPDATTENAPEQTLGHDVSGHQGPVDWPIAAHAGAKFVYVKATEGTGFINPQYGQQFNGAHGAGLIRGAYHFARPDISDGASQANYFIDHGGGWSKDGKTIPGALDVEYNPYGEICYGKDPAAMTAWIKDFTKTYLARVGRSSVIYTSTSWWKRCTGNNADFGNTNPLWLARYAPQIGELPAGWEKQSIWQFANAGTLPGDQNYYNGPFTRVQALANG